jgi:hypothetical protein
MLDLSTALEASLPLIGKEGKGVRSATPVRRARRKGWS